MSPAPSEVGTYVHDASGNLESVGGYAYHYTSSNMIKRAEVAQVSGATAVTEYLYDGDNLRKMRSQLTGQVGSDLFYHGPHDVVLSEFRRDAGDPSARWVRDYVYLGTRLVASLAPEQPAFALTTTSSTVGEAAGSITVTARLTTPDAQPLTTVARVTIGTVDGSATAAADFTFASSIETFAIGTPSGTTRSITIPILNDSIVEALEETFTVHLSSPQNARIAVGTHTVTILDDGPKARGHIDTPVAGAVVFTPFLVGGWGHDERSTTGTNVDPVHLYASAVPSGTLHYLGPAVRGDRPDVAGVYGPQFLNSGYTLANAPLPPPGVYDIKPYFYFPSSGTWGNPENEPYRRITVEAPAVTTVDVPTVGQTVSLPFTIGGWAIDRSAASGPGVDLVEVVANPLPSGPPIPLGPAYYGGPRPDVANQHGAAFELSGFGKTITNLGAGTYRLDVRARSTVTGAFTTQSVTITVVIQTDPRMWLDAPLNGAVTGRPFLVGGWAIDLAAPSGPGVATVHAWAFPTAGGAPVFLGVPTYGGARADVGAFFGSQFTNSGFTLPAVSALPPGSWVITVYAMSAQTGTFNQAQSVTITIPSPNILVPIEAPVMNATVGRPFHLAGWAIDLASPTTVGVSSVRVWAYPAAGDPLLLGEAPVAWERGDVAGAFGERYRYSGWAINAGGDLAPGVYVVIVYAIAPDGSSPGYSYVIVTVQ